MNCAANRAPANCGPNRTAHAFTLAEVMAALVFMAIVIPVALEALSIASRAGEVAARKTAATLVAERLLNENIVTTNWNIAVQNGVVRQGIQDFRWTLKSEPWNFDPYQNAMQLLSVEVSFDTQGHTNSVKVSTLVPDWSIYAQTNTSQSSQ